MTQNPQETPHSRNADSTHWTPFGVMLSLVAFNFYVHSKAQHLLTHNFYNLTAGAWPPRVEKENVFPLINHTDTYLRGKFSRLA